MSGIPRTFCITLKETPKRKYYAEDMFKKHSLNVDFFEGINGNLLGFWKNNDSTKAPPESRIKPQPLIPGEVGCLLSHIALWKALLLQPDDKFLILEDDPIFCENFQSEFQACCNELPENWDFVYVGWLSVGDRVEPLPISERIGIHRPYGTHAYLIKKSTLPILIETNNVAEYPLDIQIHEKTLPHLNHYCFIPSLIQQVSIFNAKDETFRSLCYDWDTDPQRINNFKYDESVFLGTGWYKLERNNDEFFIWNNGKSELYFSNKWKYLDLNIIAEGGIEHSICEIHFSSGKPPLKVELEYGLNTISIDIENENHITISTKTFNPSLVYKSNDRRSLGIRIIDEIILTDKSNIKTSVAVNKIKNHKL